MNKLDNIVITVAIILLLTLEAIVVGVSIFLAFRLLGL